MKIINLLLFSLLSLLFCTSFTMENDHFTTKTHDEETKTASCVAPLKEICADRAATLIKNNYSLNTQKTIPPEAKELTTKEFTKNSPIFPFILEKTAQPKSLVGVRSLDFYYNKSEAKIVFGCLDSTVKIFNNKTKLLEHTLIGHTDQINSVAFSPVNNTRVLSASDDKTAKTWNTEKETCLYTLESVEQAHFSPDGTKIVSLGEGFTFFTIWDANTGTCQYKLPYKASSVYAKTAFNHDSSIIFISCNEGFMLKALNANDRNLIHEKYVCNIGYAAKLSPRESIIVAGGIMGGHKVVIWDIQTNTFTDTFPPQEHSDFKSVTFSPDESEIVGNERELIFDFLAGSSEYENKIEEAKNSLKIAKVWNAQTGNIIHTLEGHTDTINFIVYSPDGSKIATGSNDNTAKVWDAEEGTILHTLAGHTGAVTTVVFNPDGSKVVTKSNDKTVKIWDTETGQPITTFSYSPCKEIFRPDTFKEGNSNPSLLETLNRQLSGDPEVLFSPDGGKIIIKYCTIYNMKKLLQVENSLKNDLSLEQLNLLCKIYDEVQKNSKFSLFLTQEENTLFSTLPPKIQSALKPLLESKTFIAQ